MSIIDLATAKLHLRVDDSAEDATIQIYLDAAEAASSSYLNRNVYADSSALTAAQSAAPAALATATATYTAAVAAADLMEDGLGKDTANQIALENYQLALSNYKRTMKGMVINNAVKAAILMHCGTLFATRESVSQMPGNYMIAVPLGYQWMLDPYRLEMGV